MQMDISAGAVDRAKNWDTASRLSEKLWIEMLNKPYGDIVSRVCNNTRRCVETHPQQAQNHSCN